MWKTSNPILPFIPVSSFLWLNTSSVLTALPVFFNQVPILQLLYGCINNVYEYITLKLTYSCVLCGH